MSVKAFHKSESTLNKWQLFGESCRLGDPEDSEFSARASGPRGSSADGHSMYLDELIILHIVQSV